MHRRFGKLATVNVSVGRACCVCRRFHHQVAYQGVSTSPIGSLQINASTIARKAILLTIPQVVILID
jgi:hypothetical protein